MQFNKLHSTGWVIIGTIFPQKTAFALFTKSIETILAKSISLLSIICVVATSCSSVRQIPKAGSPPGTTGRPHPVNGIPDVGKNPSHQPGKRIYKSGQHTSGFKITGRPPDLPLLKNIESLSGLQIKYAISLDIPVEAVMNGDLLNYLEEWYGTPYRYGGNTKRGIDCSAFTSGLLSAVFGIKIPRTVKEQYDSSEPVSLDVLETGDLVFFDTGKGISHVGVYLANYRFIHASTSHGVMISDLNEEYFYKKFLGARRGRQ